MNVYLSSTSLPLASASLEIPWGRCVTEQDVLLQGPEGSTLAHETLKTMQQHGISPSAANYRLWLEYRLGGNARLKDAFDARLASGEKFTPDFLTDVYERLFGDG